MRAFVALAVSAEVQARLGEVVRELGQSLPPAAVRWTRPEQIHLTLRFLGEVPEGAAGGITAALRAACVGTGPLALRAAQFGVFPQVSRPRVLWIGVAGELERLTGLQQRVAHATAEFGEAEERGFHAHLTLGRVNKVPPQTLRQMVAVLQAFRAGELGAWTAERVQLMRSELAPGGSRYTQLGEIPLSGTP